MNPIVWLRRRSDGFWVTFVIFGSLLAGAVLMLVAIQYEGFRNWLVGNDSGSAMIRNYGLIAGGVIAAALAVWRSRVAERQAATAERGLLNDRFQKGAEMLGSKVLPVRIGGIYGLKQLAGEYPEKYHVEVMRLFCSFVRGGTAGGMFVEDGKAVLDAIGARRKCHQRLERDAEYWLDLSSASLEHASLLDANLSSLELGAVEGDARPKPRCTDLSGANCREANFGSANLKNVDLSRAFFLGANLSDVDLSGANLSGARFSGSDDWKPATGLTQSQLDQARADPDNPPYLGGVIDAETGMPLVWRGRPLNDETHAVS